jgi:D-aminoacyl-tRNA deacylase
MRVVIQRVSEARVEVDGQVVGSIGQGLMVLVCAMDDESPDLSVWAKRLCSIRVFADTSGKMSDNVQTVGGSILLVPQFTLSADMKKGLRPSFGRASAPSLAAQQIERLAAHCEALGVPTQTGQFGADMAVHLINDGPVTICIDKP